MNEIANQPSVDASMIAAPMTADGRSAIGCIRVSGPLLEPLLERLCPPIPHARHASLRTIQTDAGEPIDQVIVLYYKGPHSFTGEDVVEIQHHGNPSIQENLLQRLFALGATPAGPGEFSKRAFINGRLDLTQAEAIADLIAAESQREIRLAQRSLAGGFSQKIEDLHTQLLVLVAEIEANLDFTDESDVVERSKEIASIAGQCNHLHVLLAEILSTSLTRNQLSKGHLVLIAGVPNAGKSTLFNCLANEDLAIVNAAPGTTRDLLRTQIQLTETGTNFELVDSAGLHSSDDPIELEGMRRAHKQVTKADLLVWMIEMESSKPKLQQSIDELRKTLEAVGQQQVQPPFVIVLSKADLATSDLQVKALQPDGDLFSHWPTKPITTIQLSSHNGRGIAELLELIKQQGQMQNSEPNQTVFLVRERHLQALRAAQITLQTALDLINADGITDLAAEACRATQGYLGSVTGQTLPDDLLNQIFSTFCIGK